MGRGRKATSCGLQAASYQQPFPQPVARSLQPDAPSRLSAFRFLPSALRLRVLVLLALAGLGCDRGPHMVPVTGHVTYNGEPVSQGEISFVPHEKELAPDGGKIRDGRYDLRVKPGRKTVQIRASRPVEQDSPAMEVRYADYIPAKFNRESTLTVEVGSTGEQFDFDL